jgi:hypothetical protein
VVIDISSSPTARVKRGLPSAPISAVGWCMSPGLIRPWLVRGGYTCRSRLRRQKLVPCESPDERDREPGRIHLRRPTRSFDDDGGNQTYNNEIR